MTWPTADAVHSSSAACGVTSKQATEPLIVTVIHARPPGGSARRGHERISGDVKGPDRLPKVTGR